MPIQTLRLINPGRRRKKVVHRRKTASKKGLRVVRTPNGVRYLRNGRFVSAASAKRSRAAKRRAAAKRAAPKARKAPLRNPRKRVVRKKRAAPKRKRVVTRKANPRKRTVRRKRRNPVAKKRVSRKRSMAAKKAARTRARKKAARSLAAKKAARSRRKRNGSLNPRRRKRNGSLNPRRRRRRNGSFNPKARQRRRKRNGSLNPRRRRRNGSLNPRRRRRRGAKGRFVAHKYTRVRRKLYRRVNPGMKDVTKALMQGAVFWAGLTGMKALNGIIKEQVDKMSFAQGVTGTKAQLLGLLPAGLTFAASVFLAPKVIKKKNLLDAVQMGATVAALDAVFDNFIYGSLPPSVQKYFPQPAGAVAAAAAAAPAATSGYGAAGYVTTPISGQVGEYVDYDNRLGEYVDYDNRYGGYEVSEALADADMAYIQSGGAGGIFAKTSLGWG